MTVRLGHLAVTHFMAIDGYAAAHNSNPWRLPIRRTVSFIYHMMTRNGDAKGIAKFDAHLWKPPKGVAPDRRSPWSPENETRAFNAVKAMIKGG